MDWWQAMLLGIVEGVTEYLPVSSTGHLILTQRLLGIPANQAAGAYAVCIQAGAILAVLGLYRAQVKRMLNGLLGRDRAGLALAGNIVVAFFLARSSKNAFSACGRSSAPGLSAAWPFSSFPVGDRWTGRKRRLKTQAWRYSTGAWPC